MKKWLSMFLILVLALALVGCVSPDQETTGAPQSDVTTESTEAEEDVFPTVTIEPPVTIESAEK